MERRVAACLHADVTGYCRLIREDVHATVRTLTAYRTVMANLVSKHEGRIVDTAGDSLLAEFGSVDAAVRCAVAIQRDLAARNADLPSSRRIEFRLGIDVGEVLVLDGRLYGDCVNIAARVQEGANPGSVSVAGSAYDRLGSGIADHCEYLGERAMKNFERPLRVYRIEPAPLARPEHAGPDRAEPVRLNLDGDSLALEPA
jgi:adenylate cyclase